MSALNALVGYLALGGFSALAAPTADVVASEQTAIAARQASAFVYACQNSFWGEPCNTFGSGVGTCYNVPGDWNDKISSIRNLNTGVYNCVWYQHSNCAGASYGAQDDGDLSDGGGQFNDYISSWRCSRK